MDFWKECISEAFEDAGITATDDQIGTVGSWVEGAHENYGMAHGHDCIPNPLESEVSDLKAKLKREQDKQICYQCHGLGRYMGSDCWKCNGNGFIYI